MDGSEKKFCFVSYSRGDSDAVKELVSDLEKKGVKLYIDYRDIPTGSVYAEEIVSAIENSVCCILVFTEESNRSRYVLNEMNSAATHNKDIIPLRLDSRATLGKALEFYVGKYQWVEYIGDPTLDEIKATVDKLSRMDAPKQKEVRCKGPVVISGEKMKEIGFDIKDWVTRTIEIDYLTLAETPDGYELGEDTEGTVVDWIAHSEKYPETSSMLVINDEIVGYYLLMLLDESVYASVVSGEEMVKASMQEFYGFGGDYCCYIAMMPVLKAFETQEKYMMLMDEFVDKMTKFASRGINISKYAVSVYAPLLESMMKALGFKIVGENKIGGKIMQLTKDDIISNRVFKIRYPEFYKLYAEG